MTRRTIRRVAIWPVARLGCVVGGLMALLPACVLALLVEAAVRAVASGLDGMRTAIVQIPPIELPLVGSIDVPDPQVDLVQQLGLTSFAAQVADLVAGATGLSLLIVVGVVVAAGAWTALTVALVALVYNASAKSVGGIEVEVCE